MFLKLEVKPSLPGLNTCYFLPLRTLLSFYSVDAQLTEWDDPFYDFLPLQYTDWRIISVNFWHNRVLSVGIWRGLAIDNLDRLLSI